MIGSKKVLEVLVVVLLLSSTLVLVESFTSSSSSFASRRRTRTRDVVVVLREQPEEWQGFNPFDAAKTGVTRPNVFSMRKIQMEEILTQLLNCPKDDDNDEKIRSILEEHQEFLLEPLDQDDAVLEPDSIYTADMDRSQRYNAYREQMQQRIQKARRPEARRILESIMSFILSFE